jgi:hypothetical protein
MIDTEAVRSQGLRQKGGHATRVASVNQLGRRTVDYCGIQSSSVAESAVMS